jgi:acetolactate synthase-1/2/3 large subunit
LAQAYGIASMKIEGEDFASLIDLILSDEKPVLADVILDPTQVFEPKLSSRKLPDGRMVSAPLEDMFPFLSREELQENLFIPIWDEQA